jgi:hypothetical protein
MFPVSWSIANPLTCPCDKSSMKMNMIMEHYWSDTGERRIRIDQFHVINI